MALFDVKFKLIVTPKFYKSKHFFKVFLQKTKVTDLFDAINKIQ